MDNQSNLPKKRERFSFKRPLFSEAWKVRLSSLFTAALGIINVLSAVTPALPLRLRIIESYLPLLVRSGGHLTAALAGFALISLSAGLWRRKRAAWTTTLLLLVVSAISHIIKGLDYEEAILAIALILWLLKLQAHFYARSDAPSLHQGLLAVVSSFCFILIYGVTGFFLLDRNFSINFGLGPAIRQTVVMFFAFQNPGLEPIPITPFGSYFIASIYIVSVATFAYALYMVLRPVLQRRPASLQERTRAKAIIESCGHTSLARMALFDDKTYYFSPGGSVIAFAAYNGAAVSLGDPIGPPEDLVQAISGFKTYCARNDWAPAFYQVMPDNLDTYYDQGFKSLKIGSEGIVELNSFTIAGGSNKGLRSNFNQKTRLGYKAEISQPPHPPELLVDLRTISDAWLADMHGTEKRFSLGWFDVDYLQSCTLILIINPENQVVAFTNLVTEYQRNEITIDLMRYMPGEHGLMDFMFVSMFKWACDAGFESFNLGLSPLSGIGENPEDPGIERTLHFIYEHINQFYNFKGLHEYKSKFNPDWSPRFLIYPNSAALPSIGLSINTATGGGDFYDNYLIPMWESITRRRETKLNENLG